MLLYSLQPCCGGRRGQQHIAHLGPQLPRARRSFTTAAAAKNIPVIKPQDLDPAHKTKFQTLLSLDGGGMRGLITAQVLVALEDTIKHVITEVPAVLTPEAQAQVHLRPFEKDRKLDPTSFDINLGDWFDQLAGTSTGGLLALYLALRGSGSESSEFAQELLKRGIPPGSARAAAAMYDLKGGTIFRGGSWLLQLRSGARYKYDVPDGKDANGKFTATKSQSGLNQVLQEVFGDLKLSDLQTDTVITTVDVKNARTAAFFSRTDDDLKYGFATPIRQSEQMEQAYLRQGNRLNTSQPSQGLGDLRLKEQRAAWCGALKDEGKWLVPIQFTAPLDFTVHDVARATSAAPAFLPPVKVAPVESHDGWGDGITFVDGGLGNNDPVWMGLAMMLLPRKTDDLPTRTRNYGIEDIAILSIGTGAASDSDLYSKDLRDLPGFAAGLTTLTMSLNGEDKENIFRLLYYGLLDRTPGQYTRVQLYHENTLPKPSPDWVWYDKPLEGLWRLVHSFAGDQSLQKKGMVFPSFLPGAPLWLGLTAVPVSRRLSMLLPLGYAYLPACNQTLVDKCCNPFNMRNSNSIAQCYDKVQCDAEEAAALNSMDNASEPYREAYKRVGSRLAYKQRCMINRFVGRFMFNLTEDEQAAAFPA